MRAPLEGILVVDLSRHLPGPYAARMLANLGARIVKVEEPELGDPVRMAPPFAGPNSLLATALLAGIESIALDLKRDGGREVLHAVMARADVLLETFRPGTMARLGLDLEELRAAHPRLIICSLSGWGQDGPAAARAGHDLTYQAAAGSLAATGRAPHFPSADLLGAWGVVSSINAALFARERNGEGTYIDASLFDAAVASNVTNLVEEGMTRGRGAAVPSPGALTGALPCYRVYRARDDRLVALAALEPKFWRSFCEAVGRADLLPLQYRRDSSSHRQLETLFSGRSGAEWESLFVDIDLPGELVATAGEGLESPQAAARGLDRPQATGAPYPTVIGGSRPAAGTRVPKLGEQTRTILAEFCPSWLERTRRERLAEGVGSRSSLKRALRRWAHSRAMTTRV